MLLSIQAAAIDFEVNNMRYRVLEDSSQSVRLVQTITPDADGVVAVPDEVQYQGTTYRVSEIGSLAFYMLEAEKLLIGKNVLAIAGDAFTLSMLRRIDVDGSNKAFQSEDGVLYSSGYRILVRYPNMREDVSFALNPATEEIGAGAMADCPYLEEVSIPEGVRIIGDEAFYDDNNLSLIVIPSTVEEVGVDAFAGTAWLASRDSGSLYCGNHVLALWKGPLPSDGVIEVADDCLTIARGFDFSGLLGTLRIPAGVMKVGKRYRHIMNYEVASENMVYRTTDGVLMSKDGTILELYPGGREGAYVVPQGVISVADDAFAEVPQLTRIMLPEGVEKIGARAFSQCLELERVDLPASLREIGDRAFDLRLVELPTAFPIMKAQNEEGLGAFPTVFCRAVNPPAAHVNTFLRNEGTSSTLYVPMGAADAYRSTLPWSEFDEIIEMDFADVDGNNVVNGSDVTALYDVLLNGGEAPAGADVDGNGVVNGSDATALYNRLLK